jgi:serine/threonine protein kinase
VLHKDLKPANVLLVPGANGGWQIKIADFGSASPSILHDCTLWELRIWDSRRRLRWKANLLLDTRPEFSPEHYCISRPKF